MIKGGAKVQSSTQQMNKYCMVTPLNNAVSYHILYCVFLGRQEKDLKSSHHKKKIVTMSADECIELTLLW